jgi:hypothetical protein
MSDLTISPTQQSYQTFIFNSSGIQAGNRYNSWADLMTAKTGQEGSIIIQFEQNETIPAGAYNLDYCALYGNGLAYDSGGITLTWPTGVTITSWKNPYIDSIRMYSTSNTYIWDTAVGFSFKVTVQSEMWATTAPFIRGTASAQYIFVLSGAGRLKQAGAEIFECTAAAYGGIVVIGRGDNSTSANNVIKSTNTIVYLHLIQNTVLDVSTFPGTQTGATLYDLSAKQTQISALGREATQTMANATSITPAVGYGICRQDNAQAAGTLTVNAPSGTAFNGDRMILRLKTTNAQTYAFNAIYRGSTTTALPTTLAAGKTDHIEFVYNSTDTKWDLINYRGGF